MSWYRPIDSTAVAMRAPAWPYCKWTRNYVDLDPKPLKSGLPPVASFQPNIGGLTFHTQRLLRVRYCNAWQTIMQNIHITGKNIANSYHRLINVHSTTGKRQYYLPLWLMYILPFELTDSAKLLHVTILGGGPQTPPAPLNDATGLVISHEWYMTQRQTICKWIVSSFLIARQHIIRYSVP